MKDALIQKAEKHELEVEDIINLSATRDPEVSILLQEIKEMMNWPTTRIENENGSITPPMGMWADVATEYILNGYDGLYELAQDEQKVSFVISFLEEYKTTESVAVLLKISDLYSANISLHKNTLIDIVSGLNLLLSFPGAPEIEELTCQKARELIHKVLNVCESQAEYSTTICALRGVGNEDSIKLIAKVPKLVDAWSGTESLVKKAIKKRMKKV
jgi:predicted transcriptional regulator